MPLIRNEVYQYLLQCHEEEEVQEIVGAYVFSKYRAGNSDVQVLLKLQQLAQFLKFRYACFPPHPTLPAALISRTH
ncbi:hypothetical protein RQP46_001204 [Phenoliferia psychrophenolica]